MWHFVQQCEHHQAAGFRCKAMAIGSGSEGANTALQEEHRGDLTFTEAEVLVLKTLKQVMEEKVGPWLGREAHALRSHAGFAKTVLACCGDLGLARLASAMPMRWQVQTVADMHHQAASLLCLPWVAPLYKPSI